ncbi:hypothetical protein ASPWEDRAFT_40788 [Aspergillus wentii DTO 134E9]|uniref:Uncharacterized protein n=1 Tax=Aspergillus wentii DTO 134E9 TaxID=1073089 RepID=A0A1L9RL20_ASPWE|nr:uncharacterized protein ASPWEDRAFT_40788 [Aspergillus wentii DTO 134E9]KAI9924653.1 hypothetical protein MW887_006928 [Aspergillus wentii]OJJ35583.1 hypothetical protein ASPWEDRAFT_40788 [Aspergillus wentii DTO 134E9]
MGWFWGSNNDDPVKKLDPGLREYLEHEAPAKYVPTTQIPSAQDPSQTVDTQSQPSQPAPEATEPPKPTVPAASLYPDGRYADLWKTYKPPSDVEGAEVKGASRVIEKYKERKDTVHRAAMENCALEHEDLTYCFQTGNWQKQLKARMTLCSEENSTFSRCFTTQAKFLQALGYASSFNYDEDKEERIQMHADKLYHQMLDYEKQVKEAREAGQEPPPMMSLFNPKTKPTSQQADKPGALEIPGGEQIPAGFRPSKPLERLSPHERELEIRAHNAQLEQQKLYMEEASPFMKNQEDARQKRREKAVGWFGETIGKWVT